jgi:hypothetical protein
MIVPIATNAVPSAQPPAARLHDESFPVIAGRLCYLCARNFDAHADAGGSADRSADATVALAPRSQENRRLSNDCRIG